jgi:hypothetical protein
MARAEGSVNLDTAADRLIFSGLPQIPESTFLPEHLKNNQVAYQKVALTLNL